MPLPLQGTRVVDLSYGTAGPYCTRMLADYGADIIKIEEPPGGDPARRMWPFYHDEPGLEKSGLFLFLNTSKRGMTLDIRTERGKDILRELVRRADILIEGYKPGYMATLGLGYDVLSKINPKLVMTSITNFGQSGPYLDWPEEDITIYGMGGDMIGSGDIELEPLKTSGRMASFHVGYAAALATAVALWQVEQTGQGDWVDVSAFEVTMQSTDSRLLRLLGYQYDQVLPKREALHVQMGVGSGVYQCQDGLFMITAGPSMLDRVARMIGMEDLLEQPGWNTVAARSRPETAEEFDVYMVPWCLERTKRQVQEACIKHGVLGAPFNTVEDLVKDYGFAARGFFKSIEHPFTGTQVYPGYQFRLHGTGGPMPARRPAPLLGQHTKEVLMELGYKGEDVSRLREQGVI